MSDWTLHMFGDAVTELLPAGFFKTGASYEDAYLVILELVKANRKQLLDIVKQQQPDNFYLEMYKQDE